MTDQANLNEFQVDDLVEDEYKNQSEEWGTHTLSDVIEINNYPTLEKDKKHTYVGMKHLARNVRRIQNTKQKEYKYSAPRFENGDTLFARITPCLENGKTAYVDVLNKGETAFGSTEFIVMSPTERTLPKFVYYTARRPEVRQYAIKRMTGTSGRQRVPTDVFDGFDIKLPPISEQKRIVSILDSLDTKIDINNQINHRLEKSAQTLYKSWFIDFEPYDEFKNSELGEIPVGFEVTQFSELCETYSGGPRQNTEEYIGDKYKWMTAKDATSDGISTIYETERKLKERAINEGVTKLMEPNSVLLTSRATIGEAIINKEPMATNQGYICIEPKENIPPHYLLQLINSRKQVIKNRATGSTYPEISQSGFESIPVALAPKNKRSEYDELISPCYEHIYNNLKMNSTLADIRDTLLPKLMNGEIQPDPDTNNEPVSVN